MRTIRVGPDPVERVVDGAHKPLVIVMASLPAILKDCSGAAPVGGADVSRPGVGFQETVVTGCKRHGGCRLIHDRRRRGPV